MSDLQWFVQRGCGYLDVTGSPYSEAYFDKYAGYAKTPLGEKINAGRLEFVARHYNDKLVDIGIGCGQFVETRAMTYGYDVNPAGVAWLKSRGRFVDPYEKPVAAASFWDSLEHIKDPGLLLNNVQQWAFVSMPIFTSKAHVLRSKHYRPDEHYWYFTESGFLNAMEDTGFNCLEISEFESDLGREDIISFAFKRK